METFIFDNLFNGATILISVNNIVDAEADMLATVKFRQDWKIENPAGVNEDEDESITMRKAYYPPSDSIELYDDETDTFYNASGQRLRDPSEYDANSEGYTPFGDE